MTNPPAPMAVGRFDTVVLDCPDPRTLAEFYAGLLGQEIDLGATALAPTTAPEPEESSGFRVYADRADRPFCLCRSGPQDV